MHAYKFNRLTVNYDIVFVIIMKFSNTGIKSAKFSLNFKNLTGPKITRNIAVIKKYNLKKIKQTLKCVKVRKTTLTNLITN